MAKYQVLFQGHEKPQTLPEGGVLYDSRLSRRGTLRGFENKGELTLVTHRLGHFKRQPIPKEGATGKDLGISKLVSIRRTPER